MLDVKVGDKVIYLSESPPQKRKFLGWVKLGNGQVHGVFDGAFSGIAVKPPVIVPYLQVHSPAVNVGEIGTYVQVHTVTGTVAIVRDDMIEVRYDNGALHAVMGGTFVKWHEAK